MVVYTCEHGVVFRGAGDFACELLERLALGFGDQESGEDAQQHEQGKDLQDVVQPGAGVGLGRTASAERSESGLCDDGTDFARCGGDTVACRTVTSGEALAGHDKGG